MTRATQDGIVTRAAGGQLAPRQRQAGGRLQGAEPEDIVLPRIHVFQGLPKERELYGDYREGDLINTLTKEKVAVNRFVPIFGWVEWIKFREPRGSGLEYRTRDKLQVPAKDLEWDRVNGKPPAATKTVNWACLLDGGEAPVVFSFKTTALKTGQTINTLETMRGHRGPGMYELTLRKKENAKGKWLSPEVRPVGDPTPEQAALVQALFDSLSGATVTTNLEEDPGQFDPEAE